MGKRERGSFSQWSLLKIPNTGSKYGERAEREGDVCYTRYCSSSYAGTFLSAQYVCVHFLMMEKVCLATCVLGILFLLHILLSIGKNKTYYLHLACSKCFMQV